VEVRLRLPERSTAKNHPSATLDRSRSSFGLAHGPTGYRSEVAGAPSATMGVATRAVRE